MSSLLLGGNRNQEWINRGATERAAARFSRGGFFASMTLNLILVVAIAYVASLPREKAVVIAEQRDGSYAPYGVQAQDERGEQRLLADWFADWRLGSTDPNSMQAQQTAALILPSSDVARQVQAYNQDVASRDLSVAPNVRSVVCAGFDCVVDWDETVTDGVTKTPHALRGYVTIAFADAKVALHNDGLLNPFGMYVPSLRVVEVGVNRAR